MATPTPITPAKRLNRVSEGWIPRLFFEPANILNTGSAPTGGLTRDSIQKI